MSGTLHVINPFARKEYGVDPRGNFSLFIYQMWSPNSMGVWDGSPYMGNPGKSSPITEGIALRQCEMSAEKLARQ